MGKNFEKTGKKLKINVFQITSDSSKAMPDFPKYNVSLNPENVKRETAHFRRYLEENPPNLMEDGEYFGLLSPRFTEKTGLSQSRLINVIESNPNFDVYLINPYPYLFALNFNSWTQGEVWHPGLILKARRIQEGKENFLDLKVDTRFGKEESVYCNYFVGNSNFWIRYVSFLNDVDLRINEIEKKDKVFSQSTAPHESHAFWYAFIMERIISPFLIVNKDLKVFHISPEMKQNHSKEFYLHKFFDSRIFNLLLRLGETSHPKDEQTLFTPIRKAIETNSLLCIPRILVILTRNVLARNKHA